MRATVHAAIISATPSVTQPNVMLTLRGSSQKTQAQRLPIGSQRTAVPTPKMAMMSVPWRGRRREPVKAQSAAATRIAMNGATGVM